MCGTAAVLPLQLRAFNLRLLPLPAGEVEYAEFLEIMTIQLAKLAEQKEAAAAGRGTKVPPAAARAAAAEGSGGEGGGGTTTDATATAAAVLPFDLVATAYRRKKLMGALAEDDK